MLRIWSQEPTLIVKSLKSVFYDRKKFYRTGPTSYRLLNLTLFVKTHFEYYWIRERACIFEKLFKYTLTEGFKIVRYKFHKIFFVNFLLKIFIIAKVLCTPIL